MIHLAVAAVVAESAVNWWVVGPMIVVGLIAWVAFMSSGRSL